MSTALPTHEVPEGPEVLTIVAARCAAWAREPGERPSDPDWILEIELAANAGHRGAPDVIGWNIPGVTGRDRAPEVLPPVPAEIAELLAAYERVRALDPTQLDGAQALVGAQALLAFEQQVHVGNVRWIADVHKRGLHNLVGFRSIRTWLKKRRPDGDSSDVNLGMVLEDLPQLHAAVDALSVSLNSARLVAKALRSCQNELNHSDGIIDDQPGEEVLDALVGNTIGLICRYLSGLADDDPRLQVLIARGKQIRASAGTQREQVEAAFTMLAEHVPLRSLSAHLEELVLSLVPSRLEEADRKGEHNKLVSMNRKKDGTGWHVSGDLTNECGERLFTALRSEAGRDPDNADDTAAWERLRELNESTDPMFLDQPDRTPTPMPDSTGLAWFDLPEELRPRRKGERMHDALNRLLGRYLEHGLGGTLHKVPVQVNVTLSDANITHQPGHLPARGDSGALIPRALIKRWWTDVSVTAFVMSLGGKALRAVHGQRTLTGVERRALDIETGGRCAGIDCCSDQPDPLKRLTPHHGQAFSTCRTTSLDDSFASCDGLHHDVHEGKRTILLRDGRYLNEDGVHEQMPKPEPPPF
ncbi:MAG: hypothetical protein JWM40_38 [Frankiales bacterium]|nr:hypothetical protein [Frankiales bacterium]